MIKSTVLHVMVVTSYTNKTCFEKIIGLVEAQHPNQQSISHIKMEPVLPGI